MASTQPAEKHGKKLGKKPEADNKTAEEKKANKFHSFITDHS